MTRRRALHLGLALLVLVPLVLLPQLRVLQSSLVSAGGFTLDAWRALVDPAGGGPLALWNSIWTSLASVLCAGAIGIPLALLVARVEFPMRGALAALAVLPLLLPPIVGVLTFKQFLFGEYGLVAEVLRRTFGIEAHLDGFAGVVALHAYAFFPLFYLFTAAALKRLDPALPEAARSLGASRRRTLFAITLPLLRPALAGAAVLVLLQAMGSFSAPLFFAPDAELLTLRIYNLREQDPRQAAAIAGLLAIVSLLLLLPLRKLEAASDTRQSGKGRQARYVPRLSPPARIACAAAAIALLFVLLLPHLSIAMLSFAADMGASRSVVPSEWTLQHWRRIFADDAFTRPLINSLEMASIAAALALVCGLVLAAYVVRRRAPLRGAVELLALLPMALPATVLAYSLLQTFAEGSPLTLGRALAGTWLLLPLAYFVRELPTAMRASQSALAQLDPALLDAGASLGASRVRLFTRIAWPLIRPGVLSGALLAFLAALSEFVASILLYVPQNLPIAVEIFNRRYNRSLGEPAALAVCLIAAQTVLLLLANRFVRIERAVS